MCKAAVVLSAVRLAAACPAGTGEHAVWGSSTPPFDAAFAGLGPEACTDIGPFGDAEDGQCENVTVPTLSCRWVAGSGTVSVVLPGGGFHGLSMGREGLQVQDWLAGPEVGTSACVLKYRVPGPSTLDYAQAEIADAQRAVKLARALAAKCSAGRARVGVVGFSAGGFLAGSAAVFEQTYAPVDAMDDQESSVPDFVMMVYPGLNGKVANRSLAEHIDTGDLQIGVGVPVFLEQTRDDPFDPDAQNNEVFKRALLHQGRRIEQHIYDTGSHAYGLCNVRNGTDVAALVKSGAPGPPVVPGWVPNPDACKWKREAERFLAGFDTQVRSVSV